MSLEDGRKPLAHLPVRFHLRPIDFSFPDRQASCFRRPISNEAAEELEVFRDIGAAVGRTVEQTFWRYKNDPLARELIKAMQFPHQSSRSR